MPVWQRVVGWAGTLLMLVLLAGLLSRRHYKTAPLFTLYVGGVTATSVLLGLRYSWQIWMVHQVVVAALRFVVALELTYTIFRAFPAAAATAKRALLALLVLTALSAMSVGAGDYKQFTTVLVPSLATGTVWILTALAALVLWYRLPLSVLTKAILIGFAPYLLVFTVIMNVLASLGWQHRAGLGLLSTLSYLVLLGYWSWVAWRTVPEAVVSRAAEAVSRASSEDLIPRTAERPLGRVGP